MSLKPRHCYDSPEAPTNMTRKTKSKHIFILLSGIITTAITLLLLSYIIIPLFSFESVGIPASRVDAISLAPELPATLNYNIPGIGNGTLLTNDSEADCVVVTDYSHSPLKTQVFLIHKTSRAILRVLQFNNDLVSAGIDNGVLYLFNDKILYVFNTSTGEPVQGIIKVDNYRGVYIDDGGTYLQTTFEVSAINRDWSIVSHLKMKFRCIAFGRFYA